MNRLLLCLLLAVATCGPAPAEDAWRDDGDDAGTWSAQPSWQPNPSPGAGVRSEEGSLVFSVPEAGQGMKFSRSLGRFPFSFYRYLVVRYRAENVNTEARGYFVYLDDDGPEECHALRLEDLEADGAWHTVAVDAARLAARPVVKTIAVQVPAAAADARLTLDFIAFSDSVPEGAREVRQPAPPAANLRPDRKLPLPADGWVPHADWLANPDGAPSVSRGPEGIVFRVAGAHRGMKWSCPLAEEVALKDYTYIWMRYRAEGVRRMADYAVCVIGTPAGNGMDYTPVLSPGALEADGQWHTLCAEVAGAAEVIPTARALAVQVQAASPRAALTIGEIGFSNTPRRPVLADFVSVQPGWPEKVEGLVPLDLSALPGAPAAPLRGHLGIDGWPEGERVTAEGIAFRLRAGGKEVCRTGLLAREQLSVPVGRKASEVYLFLASLFAGEEEDVRGGGTLTAIRDVDRFRVRLEYADGGPVECLPLDVRTKERRVALGPRVLCAFADPTRTLARVVLDDRIGHAGFALLAAAVDTGAKGRFDAHRVRVMPAPITPAGGDGEASPAALTFGKGSFRLANGYLDALFDTSAGLRLTRLRRMTGQGKSEGLLAAGGGYVVELRVAGKPVPPEALAVAEARQVPVAGGRAVSLLLSGSGPAAGLRLRLRLTLGTGRELCIEGEVTNPGREPVAVALEGIRVPGVRVGADAADNYYLFPQSGGIWDNAPATLEHPYSGAFPLQFMDVYNRRTGGGISLRTEDREGIERAYLLHRGEDGLATLGLTYPERPLAPGGKRALARTLVGVHPGDWHEAMAAYKAWLATWYRPAAPRRQWFREVFNFRQRFLWGHDPLYDPAAGKFRFEWALEEGDKEFGGIDYIHLFDWGYCGKYGRIYGRTGDYSPYDYWKGGLEAFREAIAGAQARGVPVGLYIEGYLLQEKGKLGQAHGKEWQGMDAAGNLRYWPQSTEMFICPWVPAWREVQAETYGRMVREAGVNGMYLDQFGFANRGKECFSPKHGHPVPGSPVVGERGLAERVRRSIDAVNPGVALYSEECPPDVNSATQDGSFTYSMFRARASSSRVPLNLMRFAIPSFKTFEILVCDQPTGSWATGVYWTFFNGEGIWLEGSAREWFEPQTLAAIRKCHGLLRAHKDAFAGDDVEALVPTLVEGIYANAFEAGGKRVYTLYNSHPETVTAEVLRVPHRDGARYEDAWSGRPLTPRVAKETLAGEDAYLSVTLGPQEAGCIVVTPAPH